MTLLHLQHPTLLLAFSLLPIKDLCSLHRVCKFLHRLISNDIGLWKTLVVRDFGWLDDEPAKTTSQNPFLQQYQEKFAVPLCDELAVKIDFIRLPPVKEVERKELAVDDFSVLAGRVIGKLRFTVTFFNKGDTSIRICKEMKSDLQKGACIKRSLLDHLTEDSEDPDFIFEGSELVGPAFQQDFHSIKPKRRWEFDLDACIVESPRAEGARLCVVVSDLYGFLVQDDTTPIHFYVDLPYARRKVHDSNIGQGHLWSKSVNIGSVSSYR